MGSASGSVRRKVTRGCASSVMQQNTATTKLLQKGVASETESWVTPRDPSGPRGESHKVWEAVG